MLKAGALLYAVFICFMIALLCSGLLLISELNNKVEINFETRENLLLENNTQFNYLLGTNGENGTYESSALGIASDYKFIEWGFFKVLHVTSIVHKDTVNRSGLIAPMTSLPKDDVALYLMNNGKPLRVSGNVSIRGDMYLSPFGMKTSYISSKTPNKLDVSRARIKKSEKSLPKFDDFWVNRIQFSDANFVDGKLNESYINSFGSKTLIVDVSSIGILNNMSFEGNVVVVSDREIIVSENNSISDIMILAPSVIFKKGFRGNAQVFARDEIILEEQTVLEYPSLVYVKGDGSVDKKISLKEGAKFVGIALIYGKYENANNERFIDVEKEAVVVGQLFCSGKIQLKGELIGSLYAERLFLKTLSANYENTLFNAKINAMDLPDNFMVLPFKKSQIKNSFVKELY